VFAPFMLGSVTPAIGVDINIAAFAVIVVGTLGNPLGTVLGGIIYGVSLMLMQTYLDVVLDRLLDLLLIAVLLEWFSRPEAGAPSWFAAQGDPVVGPALRLLHDYPAHPWPVSALAARTGVSRAALGRRFTDLVGEPPMAYLTNWRLALAADLLREPDATVAAVARKVGYGSPFALSAAFKRVRGVSPQQHRDTGVAS
jgi:AraC-like DNA-binding protein